MTEQEVAIFYDLFIRNGYVLNFYDRNSFDIFTQKSIGIPLCEKYQKSAVKALMSFLCNDATSDEKETLLFDLFDYYEKQACYKGERESTDVWGDGTLILRDEEYGAKYDVCRKIVDKLCNNSNPTKDIPLGLFQHHDAGRDRRAVEQVVRQLDDAVDKIVIDQILADLLFRALGRRAV